MIGKNLSHYKVLEKIGQGGMGEVYRAEDTNLSREVAIKVLPEQFTSDPQRLARFEREAKLLAQLNHPNIAAIYGFEKAEGVHFLALELVPGETLAERVAKGPLPVEEALEVCRQIAEGVEAAHEKGVIHRDLKPANVKVTPEGKVKILDFGLAKAFEEEVAEADISQSPTLTEEMTRAGVILGTAAYMSPEQAKGKPVDKRADVFAFGAMLYELLTGKRAFKGETITETIAKVLESEPKWEALPENTPWNIRTLLRRCLTKDVHDRLDGIGNARTEIKLAVEEPTTASPVGVGSTAQATLWKRMIPWSIAVLMGGIAVATFWNMIRLPLPAQRTSRTVVNLLPDHRLRITGGGIRLALSSDGTTLAYIAVQPGGQSQLFLRRLDDYDAELIPGTEGAQYPFFSPEGQWVGFFANGKLQKVSMAGGTPLTICSFGRATGASWGPDETIVFGGNGVGLFRVSASGGTPEILTTPDFQNGEVQHGHPRILPDGKTVLFTIGTGEGSHVGVLSLETGEWRVLLRGGAGALYLPTGHLVYSQFGKLRLVSFDLAEQELTSSAIPILDGVGWENAGGMEIANFAVSQTGTLAYVPGGYLPGRSTPVWVNHDGLETALAVDPGRHLHPRLSSDSRRIALTRTSEGVGTGDIWIIDVERGTQTRLTVEGTSYTPLWTPDDMRVTYVSNGNIFWKSADGSDEAQPLLIRDSYQRPWSWSPDGQLLLFDERTPIGLDIWVLPLEGDPVPVLTTSFSETDPAFSPDGRWLAYVSDQSGRYEVYLQPYPGPGERWLVSTDGGREPLWSTNGEELFYRTGTSMMAVSVEVEPSFTLGTPRLLFEEQYFSQDMAPNYDVLPDSQQFVMIRQDALPAPTKINVVLNWFEELKLLVPTN
jgi:Tol biopolymer transport system component/predicted Ser/Thr protein kinase